MKRLRIVLIFATQFILNASLATAQVSLNVNISSQPLWGPVSHDHVEYYYMPEYGMYYYAPKAQFIYPKGNKWLFSNRLPYQYRNADLYSTYKVVINESNPYLRNDHFANYYKQYKQGHHQQDIIRDSHDEKYTVRKDHPNHAKYKASAPNNTARFEAKKSNNTNSSKKKDKKQGKK
jgi:hypothetical protein